MTRKHGTYQNVATGNMCRQHHFLRRFKIRGASVVGGGASISGRNVDPIENPTESDRDVISSDSLRKLCHFLDRVINAADVDAGVQQGARDHRRYCEICMTHLSGPSAAAVENALSNITKWCETNSPDDVNLAEAILDQDSLPHRTGPTVFLLSSERADLIKCDLSRALCRKGVLTGAIGRGNRPVCQIMSPTR